MIEWRDIRGFKGMYQISNTGMIKSLPRKAKRGDSVIEVKGKFLRKLEDNGYYKVRLFDKDNMEHRRYVHVLVADAFIPKESNKPEVNHKDGNRGNNKVENLEWCSRSENVKHSWEMRKKK